TKPPAGASASAPVSGGGSAIPHAEVVGQFSEASRLIQERAQSAFEKEAREELATAMGDRAKVYEDALGMSPYMLVGREVPNLRGDGVITIKDTTDAREWQEAAKMLIDRDIESRTKTKLEAVKPMLSVVQDSIQLFQNNPDI